MRGSVVKKGTRWYVKIELDPDPATGQRRQKWHSGYNTKREAERARIDLLSKFDFGANVEPSHQTVADYFADWLKATEHTVRPSTFDSYSRNVKNHVVAHIGPVRLTKVDAGVLNGLYAELLTSGRCKPSRTGKGYSPEVVERANKLRSQGVTLAATAEQLRSVHRGRAHHQGHARVTAAPRRLHCDASKGEARSRSADGELRPHDHPPSVQGRCPMESPRAQPGRRCQPSTRWQEVRRHPCVGRADPAGVPRRVVSC